MIFLWALYVGACVAKTQVFSTKSVQDEYILVPVASSKSLVRQVERVIWCFAMQENQRVDNCEEPGLYRVIVPHAHLPHRAPSTVAIKAEMLLNSKALERSLLEIHAVAMNDDDEGEERFVEHVRFDSSVQLPLPPVEMPPPTQRPIQITPATEKTMPVATPAAETERPVQMTSLATPAAETERPIQSIPVATHDQEKPTPVATHTAAGKTHTDTPVWHRYSGSGIFLFVGLGMVSLLAMLIHRVKYNPVRDIERDSEAAMVLKHPIMDEEEDDFVVLSKEEQHDELQFLMQLGTGANPAFAQNL